jgi:transmembrane sensor
VSEARDKATTGIRESAADWAVRWNAADLTAEEESAFFDWLRRSPLHVKEYLRAEATWLAMESPAKADSSDVQALLRSRSENLIELNTERSHSDSTPPVDVRTGSRKRLTMMAAAAAVLLAIGITFAPTITSWWGTDTYVTSVGELRRVVMPDGSAMELNTHSKVRVRLSAAARDIYLDDGEAYFEVVRDPQRPFRVISDTAVVRALGTQFNVYRRAGKTLVTVLEGRVAVSPPKINRPVELSAGHVAESSTARVAVRTAAINPNPATAWRQRRLIFKNESLSAVIEEFNRYNRQQLMIEDPELASERISAVFDANDPRALVRFLAQQSDVRARELSESHLLLARPGE